MKLRRRTLTSPRLRKKKRSRIIKRGILGGVLAILLLFGARAVLNLDIFTIKSIEIIGADKVSPEDIKSLVSAEIDKSKFGIFSKRNFLFVNTNNISSIIQKSFPDFSKVHTTLAGLGSLVINVIERSPYAKWCYENDHKQCLIIDEKGFAFEKDELNVATTTLSIFTESKPVYETEIFDIDKFSKMKQWVDYFGQFNFKIVSVTLIDEDYFMKTLDGLEIRVKSTDNLDSIITKLTSIINDLKKENDTTSIDSIDLRHGNKVFLKRK